MHTEVLTTPDETCFQDPLDGDEAVSSEEGPMLDSCSSPPGVSLQPVMCQAMPHRPISATCTWLISVVPYLPPLISAAHAGAAFAPFSAASRWLPKVTAMSVDYCPLQTSHRPQSLISLPKYLLIHLALHFVVFSR